MDTKRLRDLREDNDKTQQQIADMLNMHRSVYRRYESGEREIPVWALIKLADYYRVSTDYLLGREDQRSVDLSGLTAAEATLICDLVASMTAKNKRMEDYL